LKKKKPTLTKTQQNGWIQTKCANIYLPNATNVLDRELMPTEEWNFSKSSLLHSSIYYDLTRKQYARGIVQLNNYVIIVV